MKFGTSNPEDLKGGAGNYLREPGLWHFAVTSVLENAYGSGKPIKGGGITLMLAVLNKEQEGKVTSVTLHNPKINSKDGGAFGVKKQTAFLVAANLVAPCDMGKDCDVDLKAATNQQIVANLVLQDVVEGEKQYLELNYWNIYHVDDPRVDQSRLNHDAVKLLPKAARRPVIYFDPILKAEKPAAPKREAVTADDL